MSIRISGGYLKGRQINSPKDGDGVRPTTERVKLAIFSILGQDRVMSKKVLDLYACSGALGIESISRGAVWVDFVEKNSRNCDLIGRNMEVLEIGELGKVNRMNCERFLRKSDGGYDVVFLDPPYAIKNWDFVMGKVGKAGFVNRHGVVIAEHFRGVNLSETYGDIKCVDSRRYGDSKISYYEAYIG